jgi:broad specificity phosphatase PhoE
MKIVFESHSTTFDNEKRLCSGWNDVALSPKGEEQSRELGARYSLDEFDAIYTADLQRGYKTAEIAFPDITPVKLRKDWRLREVNYGDLTLRGRDEVDPIRIDHIKTPFPNGKSFEEMLAYMKSFLDDLRKEEFKKVMIIGSRATHYGLDVHILGRSIEDCVNKKFEWQPGWEYELK